MYCRPPQAAPTSVPFAAVATVMLVESRRRSCPAGCHPHANECDESMNRTARSGRQILLDEAWAQMHVELIQALLTHAFEAMHLAGLDDQDVTRTRFELLSVHGPAAATVRDELDLV